jgi:enterochelin esterase-like enzyme
MNKSKTEKINLYSATLGKEMQISVYLPEGYDRQASLPVLYFLHGRSGDENIMVEAGISACAEEMISAEKIKPLIIACPKIENSRGLNSSLICKEVSDPVIPNRIINIGMYEDYFLKEVVPFVDKTFHTVNDRTGRFIGGASAGGYAALHTAFRHQQLFSKVGGHMPALELSLEDEDKPYFKEEGTWEKYDPIHIVKNGTISTGIEVYLDAGDKDEGRFYEGCSVLYKTLQEKGINVQNHIFSGNHSVGYIRSNIEKYLEFYGRK